jgi:hypothetical protein
MTNDAGFWLLTGVSIVVTITGALLQVFAADRRVPTSKRLTRIGLLLAACLVAIATLAAVLKPHLPTDSEAQPPLSLPVPAATKETAIKVGNVQSAAELGATASEGAHEESSAQTVPPQKPVEVAEDTTARAPAMPSVAGVAFVKLVRGTVSIYPICSGNSCAYADYRYVAVPRYHVENTGPDIIYTAILTDSFAFGNCNGKSNHTKGLTEIYSTSSFDGETFALIGPHATVDITTEVNDPCVLSLLDMGKTEISVVLLVSDGRRVVQLPLTLSDVGVSVQRD